MLKVIVAGSRNFNDYKVVEENLNFIFSKHNLEDIEIVSGGARGVDCLGEIYAKKNGCKLKVFTANWNKYGKSAGLIRNKEMAKYATHLVAFWDGVSRGTQSMIQYAEDLGLKFKVIEI